MLDTQRRLSSLLKLLDLTVVLISFGLTTTFIVTAQRRLPLAHFLSTRATISTIAIVALALFLCHIVFSICGIYAPRRLKSKATEIRDILRAIALIVCCFIIVGSTFSIKTITVLFLLVFWATCSVLLIACRLSLRVVLAYVRTHGRNLRFVLILGTNPRAVDFAHKITAAREYGYRVLGFVDDEWAGLNKFRATPFTVVSDYGGLAEYLRNNVVDEVAIYLPLGSFYQHASEVAKLCEMHGIVMRFSSDLFDLPNVQWCSDEFAGAHYVTALPRPGASWALAVKRALDIVVSLALLIVLAPLLIGVAIAIPLLSPGGPVFYQQERIGLNKRRFRIYKFRTMVPGADEIMPTLEQHNEMSGPVFKIRGDPRVTRFGRFLRRSSIDELPQLFNVLRGDMSLVGPRPTSIRDFNGFTEDWQRRRFSVKPGITCLWQVGGRNNVPFDRWMRMDIQYMDEWSLWLDIKILLMTVPAVFTGNGAT